MTNHLLWAVPRKTLIGRDFFVWFPIRVTNLTSALTPTSLIRSFINYSSVTSFLSLAPTPLSFSVFHLVGALPLFRSSLVAQYLSKIRQKLGRTFWPFITAAKLFGTFVIFSWKDSRSTVSQADWIFPRLVWLHLLYFVLLFLFGSATFWCHLSASLRFLAGPLLFTRLQLYAGTFPKISLFVCWTIAEIHPAL